jgi:hypothetical protein
MILHRDVPPSLTPRRAGSAAAHRAGPTPVRSGAAPHP